MPKSKRRVCLKEDDIGKTLEIKKELKLTYYIIAAQVGCNPELISRVVKSNKPVRIKYEFYSKWKRWLKKEAVKLKKELKKRQLPKEFLCPPREVKEKIYVVRWCGERWLLRKDVTCLDCKGLIRYFLFKSEGTIVVCSRCANTFKRNIAIPVPDRKPDFERSNFYRDNVNDNAMRTYEG